LEHGSWFSLRLSLAGKPIWTSNKHEAISQSFQFQSFSNQAKGFYNMVTGQPANDNQLEEN